MRGGLTFCHVIRHCHAMRCNLFGVKICRGVGVQCNDVQRNVVEQCRVAI